MGKMIISVGIMLWKDGIMLIIRRKMLLFFVSIYIVCQRNNGNQWKK
jgi:hypothetical protein